MILRRDAVNQNLAIGFLAELHNFQQRGGFTTPGFAHDREALTLTNIERYAVHGLHGAHAALHEGTLHEREMLLHVAHFKHRRAIFARSAVELRDGSFRNGIEFFGRLTDEVLRDSAGGVVPLTSALERSELGLTGIVLAALTAVFGDGATLTERAVIHRVQQIRRSTLNGHQRGLLRAIHARNRAQQTDGVGVAGVLIKVFSLSDFYRFTRVHHQNVIGHTSDNTQVVGNHDSCRTGFILRLIHNLKHLRLNGDVKRCGRLIRNKHARIVGNCHCDHDALAHTAGELMRERTQTVGGGRNTH